MVFWKTYPIINLIHSKLNTEKFKSLIFNKLLICSPTGVNSRVIKEYNLEILEELREFIKKYFGSPPKTPILDIPEKYLLGEKDYIIYVHDIEKNIVGCIRYHYLGQFISSKNEEIYCVDCFCIHPQWRKKGLGDYLLTQLHVYVNNNNISYSMFLKEGKLLSILNRPILSGRYVYKKIEKNKSNYVYSLTNFEAYRLMDVFREFNKELFIIRNIEYDNQQWKLYMNSTSKILVCFQDTFQTFYKDNKFQKMGWITAWIESPNITNDIRKSASIELVDSMFDKFDYIWMNKEWSGNAFDIWQIDGTFHWYCYQWVSSININKSYCILT